MSSYVLLKRNHVNGFWGKIVDYISIVCCAPEFAQVFKVLEIKSVFNVDVCSSSLELTYWDTAVQINVHILHRCSSLF